MANFDPLYSVKQKITEDFWERYPERSGEILSYKFTQKNPVGGNAYWFNDPSTPWSFEWHPLRATAAERLRITQMPGD